jgi:hypothetical protein
VRQEHAPIVRNSGACYLFEMARTIPLQTRIEQRIGLSHAVAFLTREFADLSGPRQVGRALAKIVSKGTLIRVGWGVYGRSVIDPLTGKHTLAADPGEVGHQAMLKLRAFDEAVVPCATTAAGALWPSPEG